jgi:uncharacterized phage-associated protein
MGLRFNEAKATQAAACLLKLRGGQMSYLKLIKLLYLADREALLRWDRPISTDRYVSMDNGPVLSRVLNLISGSYESTTGIWSKYISEPIGHDVRLQTEDFSTDELSSAEEDLLHEIFKQHGHKNRWALVRYVHTLKEWQDPNGSAIPISYGDILKAENRSPQDIAAIEEELQSLAVAQSLITSK